jgi:hypothetical protein
MTLTGLIPVIYDAYDIVAREMTGFVNHVYRNSAAEQAAVGQAVSYPVAPAATTGNITAGQLPPDDGSSTIGIDTMTISKSKYSPVRWSGEEQRSVTGQYSNILRDQFAQSFRALVNEIEVDLALAAKQGASRAVGTAGTAPFGTAGDLSDFALTRQVLDDNGAPQSDLHYVASSAAMANLRGRQSVLFKMNEAGTDDLLRRGIVGDVMGYSIGNSAGLTLHTRGTGTGYQTNNAPGYAVGATGIALDTGSGTVVSGDVVTFTGHNDAYVVGTALTGPALALNQPGLRVAVADNVAMAVGNNYTPNMAFHRNAIHLITRAPAMPVDLNGNALDSADDVTTITDPVTGLSFQVALYRMYRRVRFEIGIAWGVKVVKSEFVVIGRG